MGRINRKKLIEYLDPSELENAVVSMNHENKTEWTNDYAEIHPSMILGIMASNIPFPQHNPSPRNCYQCLDINELVIMANGSKKHIKDIKIGDQILSVNPKTYEQSITTVVNHMIRKPLKKVIRLITELDRQIVCTEDHLFLTPEGWVEAINVRYACIFPLQTVYYNSLNQLIKIDRIEYDVEKIKFIEYNPVDLVCDITTDSGNQNFITGDLFCVHNCSMGKQALGIHALSYKTRTDTITYVLDYPQKPIVSTKPGDLMGFNDMPSGINAIVAILSYSGLKL